MALRASLCYPLAPLPPNHLIQQCTSLSCSSASQSPPFPFPLPWTGPSSPSLSWAWWETALCQAVDYREQKSRLCCAVAAVAEQSPSSPPKSTKTNAPPPSAALPPSPGCCSGLSPPCAGTPRTAPASGCAARQWGGASAGQPWRLCLLRALSCKNLLVCPQAVPPLSQQPSLALLASVLEVNMSPHPPWSLWMASQPPGVSLHLSLVPSADVSILLSMSLMEIFNSICPVGTLVRHLLLLISIWTRGC